MASALTRMVATPAAWLVSALIGLHGVAAPPAHAQPLGAAVQATRHYQVPAGPLGQSLNTFAAAAGIELSVDSSLLQGRRSQGLSGHYAISEGFQVLLEGHGLRAVRAANGSYTVMRATGGPQDARVLTPIMVAGHGTLTEGTGSFTTAGPVSAATGLNLTLRETPQSITVVTRERMDQQGLQSLADVAEQVPGVTYGGSGTPIGGRTEIYARGFNINSYQVDGISVPWEALGESERYGQASLDTALYDSVTVVRGATGLLTGAGDPSASISLVRKKPTDTFQGSVSASLGRWGRGRGVVDLSGPLNEQRSVRGRLVGAYEKGKTWVNDYRNDRGMLYGVLEADLGADTLLTLGLEHVRDGSEGAPWAGPYGIPLLYSDRATFTQADRSMNAAPHWAYSDTRRTTLSAAVEHRFNDDWSGKLAYTHSRFESSMRRGMVTAIPVNGSRSTVRALDLEMSNRVDTVDAKLDGKYRLWGRQHDLVAGFNLTKAKQVYGRSLLATIPGAALWTGDRIAYDTPDWQRLRGDAPTSTSVEQYGGYVVTRLRPADRLSVILGARLSSWRTRSTSLTAPYGVLDDRRYSTEFTPYAGVVFDLTQSLSAYASYTSIFKPQSYRDVNGRLLDPERGDNYEVGLKGEWLDGRLNASLALFQTRKDNLAVRDGNRFTPTGETAWRAESQTKGRGWEVEVAGQLAPGWQLQGGYSQFVIRDANGARLNTSRPVHQFKLYTSYQPASLPALTVGAGVRWQSKTHGEGSVGFLREAYTIGSYFVADMNARYEVNERLSVAVNLNNVFNRSYRISYFDHSYGAPRNLMATMRYTF